MSKNRKINLPTKRRARGTGALFYSRSLRVWIGRVPCGKKPNGSPLYRERRAATQGELLDKLKEIRPLGPQTTVAEWCERWAKELNVRDSTADRYRDMVDRFILPSLGHRVLAGLTPGDVEFAVRQWAATGLGNGTLRTNLSTLRTCLESARRHRLIAENPVRDARKPKAPRSKIRPFEPAELARIIDAAGERPAWRLFAFLASTGARLGEGLALDVADYHGGTVRIHRTFSRVHGMRPPKSEHGNRTIRVPAPALPAVKAVARSGPLFPDRSGGRFWHNATATAWKRLLAHLRLPYRNIHQLRHSVATALISNGVPIGDVARFLGASVATIVRTYLHAAGTDPADCLEKVLKPVEWRKGVSTA